MGVLAVTELRPPLQHEAQPIRERLLPIRRRAGHFREPPRDSGVVRGGMGERPPRQLEPRRAGQTPPASDLLDHPRIIGRVGHHAHGLEVLRGGPHQRRASDVDLLDGLIERRFPGYGLSERIEVHHHEVEGPDGLRFELAEVGLAALVGQDPGVDAGVERLHPAAEHLGEPGHI